MDNILKYLLVPFPRGVHDVLLVSSSSHFLIHRKSHFLTEEVHRAYRKVEMTQSLRKSKSKRWFKRTKARMTAKKRKLSGDLFVVFFLCSLLRRFWNCLPAKGETENHETFPFCTLPAVVSHVSAGQM